jgi:formiminoglutamate deiminase
VTRYWCEWAWLDGEQAVAGVVVEVERERIAAVDVSGAGPPEGAVRLTGLTLPGLADAHSHAFHRALRGAAQVGADSFWTWRDGMYALAGRLDPDSYLALARATFGEMAQAGITTVGEFHYLHHDRDGTPFADPNEMGRSVIQAALDAGVRLTLLDTCYLHGGIGAAPAGVQQRFADTDVDAWAARIECLESRATARVGAAVHSIRAVDPSSVEVVAGWAAAHDAPLHAHVSEQPAENDASQAAYGRSPTAVLDDAGALSSRFTAVHATHITDDDAARLGRHAARCCVCPTTERDLADGVTPARRLRRAGVACALGSDSHAVIDLFEEARAVELDERLVTNTRGHHSARELLRAATAEGHASLGWADAGRLAVGAPADLVTVGLEGVRLAGARPDHLLESVVFAAGAADVTGVVVGGREIVRDGSHVRLDVPGELRRAIEGLQP